MGYREYARHRAAAGLPGTTLASVQKAIRSGRITAVNGKIDAAAADASWAATTDQALQRGAPAAAGQSAEKVLPILDGVVEAAPSTLTRRPEWEIPFPPMEPRPAGGRTATVEDMGLYQASKARREYAEAEMATDELRKRRGELLDREEVRKAFVAMGRQVAVGRESTPAQLAPTLVGLTDVGDIERRIRKYLREVDARIASEIRNAYDNVTAAAC